MADRKWEPDSIRGMLGWTGEQLRTRAELREPFLAKLPDGLGVGGRAWI